MSRTFRNDMSSGNKKARDGKAFWWSAPSWFTRMYMNRPKRHENRMLCREVEQLEDPDGLLWPLGNHKPHVYYW